MEADIRVEDHGTVALVIPMTDAGRKWITDNVETESWQWLGGALAVEPRCVDSLAAGMSGDGLAVTL